MRIRDRLLKDMRFQPQAPVESAYCLWYGSRTYFGSDTRELLDRVVKIAQKKEGASAVAETHNEAHRVGESQPMKAQLLRKTQCATCPFRPASKYANLAPDLTISALTEASRICHSTGSNNAINRRTGLPPMLCRGARDQQLAMFARTGFIAEATDSAWAERCASMGLTPPTVVEAANFPLYKARGKRKIKGTI